MRAPVSTMVRLLAVCALLLSAAAAHAQAHGSDRAKAAIVVNFAHFTRWPAAAFREPGEPLRLCVAQRSRSIAAAFGAHEGRRIGSRALHVDLDPAAGSAAGCHLLFVHESAGPAAPTAIATAGAGPTLTIGDFDGALAQGGMVELVLVNDALRFDVDLRALRAASVELSSEVLRLARQARR
jgi:hypothetical protein